MTDQQLIQQYLPEDLRDLAGKFSIPSDFLENSTWLIVMVLRSRSIDSQEEKQNWFNLLPLMNETQLDKLKGILEKRKAQT